MSFPALDPHRQEIRVIDLLDGEDDQVNVLKTKVVSLKDLDRVYAQFASSHESRSHAKLYANWVKFRSRRPLGDLSDVIQPLPARFNWGDFIAISYRWGKDQTPIVLNGHEYSIPLNLREALTAIRQRFNDHHKLYVWTDAICIAQDDKSEKDRELRRLADIFGQACRVVVWLGTQAEGSQLAMALATFAKDERERQKAAAVGLKAGFTPTRLPVDVSDHAWVALGNLFARPYWGRLWVVQELALANDFSLVFCGQDVVPLTSIWHLVRYVNRQAEILQIFLSRCSLAGWSLSELERAQKAMARIRYMADLNHNSAHGHARDLGRLTKLCRSSSCALEQDKVFGILGLMPAAMVETMSTRSDADPFQAYRAFAMAYATHSKNLEMFQYCNLSDELHSPSWAPNLSDQQISWPALDNGIPFRVDGLMLPDFTFADDVHLVINNGIHVDVVDQLFCTADGNANERQEERDIQSWWHRGAMHRYGDYDGLQRALWRTLTADRSYHPYSHERETYNALLTVDWNSSFADSNDQSLRASENGLDIWIKKLVTLTTLNADFDVFGHPFRTFFSQQDKAHGRTEAKRNAVLQMSRTLERRRFITTTGGRLGIVPECANSNDQIWVLPGCTDAVVLRPIQTGNKNEVGPYKVVGTAYLHGIMYGEATRNSTKFPVTRIVLC